LKVVIIANPISASGKSRALARAIEAALLCRKFEVELFFTHAKGDAFLVSSAVPQDCAAVVPVGGDGTLNEVLNGVCLRGIPIAPCPAGLSNALCVELGIQPDPEQIADAIDTQNFVNVDLGQAIIGAGKGVLRYFVSMAAAGFDAEIAHAIAARRRSPLGLAGYALPLARAMVSYEFAPISVEVDGAQVSSSARYIIIGNIRYYGGPLYITTGASYSDGLLDAVVFEGKSATELIRFYLGVLGGHHLRHGNVKYYQGKVISLSSENTALLHIDGEAIGSLPVTFSVTGRQVKILTARPRRARVLPEVR
jgi:YegS/Rv2252/BmrU family lipid kinase